MSHALAEVSSNPLPNNNFLDWNKFKAFADVKSNAAELRIFSRIDRVENIVEKQENAGYQHFLLFPQCFQTLSLSGLLIVGECAVQS